MLLSVPAQYWLAERTFATPVRCVCVTCSATTPGRGALKVYQNYEADILL